MPWSFVSYIETILRQLKMRGYEFECSVGELRREMMRSTGVVNSKKLAEYIHVMEELGYVRSKGENVVELCLDFSRPYEFVSRGPVDKSGEEYNKETVERLSEVSRAELVKPKPGESKVSFKKPGEKEKLEEIARLRGRK